MIIPAAPARSFPKGNKKLPLRPGNNTKIRVEDSLVWPCRELSPIRSIKVITT